MPTHVSSQEAQDQTVDQTMMFLPLWKSTTSNCVLVLVFLFLFVSTLANMELSRNARNKKGVKTTTTTTIRCGGAVARVHYAPTPTTCPRLNVAVLAVGTAMKTQDYDLLSKAIVQSSTQNIVVVVLDFNPYDPLKRSPKAYAGAVDELMKKLNTILPRCDGDPTVLVGGHSAGGSSAMDALIQNMFTTRIAGYIGLDPYCVQPVGDPIRVPALQWGFSTTTCGVNVKNAAQAAYERSSEGFRIFYQLSEPYSHCCFTNAGCMWVCSCAEQNDGLLHDIGISVDQFLSATILQSRFSRRRFSTANFSLTSSELSVHVDSNQSILARIEPKATRETERQRSNSPWR